MPQYRRLPVSSLSIDPNYQRPIDENHVKRLIKDFDEAALGTLEVSDRGDEFEEGNRYVVFDGQHRIHVLAGVDFKDAPCLVHVGLSPEQEAELFRKQDRRKPVAPVDKFRARLFAGDPVAKGMADIALAHNFQIGTGPGSIQAVVAAERSYRRGNLDTTLRLIATMWRGDAGALDAPLIDGLSRFLDLYDQEVDIRHAEHKFSQIGPKVILRRAGEFTSSSKAGGVLQVLRKEYSDRQHGIPSIEAAVANRVAREREGKTRYVRVSREEVRNAVLDLARNNGDGFYIEELREKLHGISQRALTNHKTGHLHKMMESGTVKFRLPREDERPGRIYYLAPVKRSRVNRKKQTAPEQQLAGSGFDERGVPQRGKDDLSSLSKTGEGHRVRQRAARREKQQQAAAKRAAAKK